VRENTVFLFMVRLRNKCYCSFKKMESL